MLAEPERRGKGRPGPPLGLEGTRNGSAGILLQFWLWVEGVDVARTTIGEDVNHRLGSSRKVRCPRRQRPEWCPAATNSFGMEHA
jgi:hypothetical protein